MANVRFSYLYRDAGNYKIFGHVVFSNFDKLDIYAVEQEVRARLIDGLWFYPKSWEIPDLHLFKWDEDLDHELHEFEQLAPTEMAVNTSASLTAFFALVLKTKWKY
jgi:hypothetical protein